MIVRTRNTRTVAFIGESLRTAMAAAGLRREVVAARAGVSSATLQNAISERPISRPYAMAIAKAIRVPLRSLIADETKQPEAAVAAA